MKNKIIVSIALLVILGMSVFIYFILYKKNNNNTISTTLPPQSTEFVGQLIKIQDNKFLLIKGVAQISGQVATTSARFSNDKLVAAEVTAQTRFVKTVRHIPLDVAKTPIKSEIASGSLEDFVKTIDFKTNAQITIKTTDNLYGLISFPADEVDYTEELPAK